MAAIILNFINKREEMLMNSGVMVTALHLVPRFHFTLSKTQCIEALTDPFEKVVCYYEVA